MNIRFSIVAWPVHYQSQVGNSHAYDVEPLSHHKPYCHCEARPDAHPNLASIWGLVKRNRRLRTFLKAKTSLFYIENLIFWIWNVTNCSFVQKIAIVKADNRDYSREISFLFSDNQVSKGQQSQMRDQSFLYLLALIMNVQRRCEQRWVEIQTGEECLSNTLSNNVFTLNT